MKAEFLAVGREPIDRPSLRSRLLDDDDAAVISRGGVAVVVGNRSGTSERQQGRQGGEQDWGGDHDAKLDR